MKRYCFWIRYLGTRYSGWQIQPNALSIQGSLELALSRLLSLQKIRIVGCGRTDAGVHAASFAFHADLPVAWSDSIKGKANRMLGPDIVIYNVKEVDGEWHARYSARKRTYKYLIDFDIPTFSQDSVYAYPYKAQQLSFDKMQAAGKLLLNYNSFFPFCKSKADVNHYDCQLYQSEWEFLGNRYLIYTIQANRFLRGMVRLIVGMCLRVGEGKIELSSVRQALDKQTRLQNPYSAPAKGLYLYDIDYGNSDINCSPNAGLFFPI